MEKDAIVTGTGVKNIRVISIRNPTSPDINIITIEATREITRAIIYNIIKLRASKTKTSDVTVNHICFGLSY